jgi:hypothetical protein
MSQKSIWYNWSPLKTECIQNHYYGYGARIDALHQQYPGTTQDCQVSAPQQEYQQILN